MKGQVTIAAVFVIVIVAILTMVAVSLLSTQSFYAAKSIYGPQALSIAESGVRFAMATSLSADSDWSDNANFGPISLSPGTFSVTYLNKGKRSATIEVSATVLGLTRKARVFIRKRDLPFQFMNYAVYAGTSEVSGDYSSLDNRSTIKGNVFYYGPMAITGTRPPAGQSNGVIFSSSIDPEPASGVPNYYASWEAAGAPPLLTFNKSYYDNFLAIAYPDGAPDLTLADTDNLNLNGDTLKYNTVVMEDSSTITGPGTICANVYFQAWNTARFIGFVRVVCSGEVNFGNSISWGTTAEVIARTGITIGNTVQTPADSILYVDTGNIDTSNRAIVRGSVLAPEGAVNLNNNSQIRGLAYSNDLIGSNSSTFEGSVVGKTFGGINTNAMIIQNIDALPTKLPPGFTSIVGSLEVARWEEVY
jgi:hypothetical protein